MEIKGFTYGFDAEKGDYRTQIGIESMEKLAKTGTEWACLAFIVYQDRYNSTEIKFDYKSGVKDKDLIFAINKLHDLGMKVCLKPVINCRDHVWRARIEFPDESDKGPDGYWDEWFSHYQAFLTHYAELAADYNCEMFCVGCEMGGTERKEKHWRETVNMVKEFYKGPLMYNTNHGDEEQVKWFDMVDYVGVSAYYPLSNKKKPTEEDMYKGWMKRKTELKKLSDKWGKKIIFAEVGIRSAAGCVSMPWDYLHKDLPFDEQEQADYYNSCFRAFFHEPWFAGCFWWHWDANLYTLEEAKTNKHFGIYGKKAEEVVREWYSK